MDQAQIGENTLFKDKRDKDPISASERLLELKRTKQAPLQVTDDDPRLLLR